ncbi:MAG: NADH:flavin oxidoreductase [Dehalococcoidia bacterium]
MPYEKLFSPININGMELKNRIVMAPAHEGLAALDGFVTQAYSDYYFRRAQGETAMIVLGGVAINPRPFPALRLSDDKFIPGLKEMVDRIHSETETKIVPQIYDWLKIARGWKQKVEEVTDEQIRQSPELFAAGALRAREAGFDAVELHGAHGYILSAFMSNHNKRKDEYGGNPEKRMRLTREVYQRVRSELGDDFPIGIRINGDDFIIGGSTLLHTPKIAVKLAEMGFDYISISVGGKYEDSSGTDPFGLPVPYPPWGGYSGFRCMPQQDMPDGVNLYITETIHNAVRAAGYHTPIMTAGKIPTPDLAEKILQEDKADLIGVCRQIIRDPDWPKKAREGRGKEIKKCIYCNTCLETAFTGEGGYCKLDKLEKEKEAKKAGES